jgi:hypothetical protein
MPMKTKQYKIVVYEMDAEGVTVTEIPAASYETVAVTPWDAAMQWGAQLEAEESRWPRISEICQTRHLGSPDSSRFCRRRRGWRGYSRARWRKSEDIRRGVQA